MAWNQDHDRQLLRTRLAQVSDCATAMMAVSDKHRLTRGTSRSGATGRPLPVTW